MNSFLEKRFKAFLDGKLCLLRIAQYSFAVLYLLFSVIHVIRFEPGWLGANLPYYSLIFFAGFGLSEQVAYLVLSIIMLFGSLALQITSSILLFWKKKSKLFLGMILTDWAISLLISIIGSWFVWWQTYLSLVCCVLFFCVSRKLAKKDAPPNPDSEELI